MGKLRGSTEILKDALAYLMLILFTAVLICLIYKDGFLYGSKVDWISQHVVLADYFRQKFFETGHLFPDFAMNIGGGQNIYNFSYYGLLNPIVLISYLFPAVTMASYISTVSILLVFFSGCLCYRWLRTSGFSCKISLVASICLICAGPLIFQSHRQIMFMNYLPFVFLGLMGVDRYTKKQKKGLLIGSVFFCIMTSYFFSVGSILAIVLYAVYGKLKDKPACGLVELTRSIIPFVKGIGIGVLMAGVLWLPTLYVVVNGRGGGMPISWLSLIRPTLPFEALLYNWYSLGLTGIALIAVILTLFSTKRGEKVLAIILLALLVFPLFLYLLNGTIYVHQKALIPFLPLYILILAIFLRRFELSVNQIRIMGNFWKKSIITGLFLLVIFAGTINCLSINALDDLVSTEEYMEYYSPDKLALIEETLKEDPSFFRMNELANGVIISNHVYGARYNQTSIYSSTYNRDYNRFFYDVMHNPIPARNRVICFPSKNILFQNFMNVKYVIARGNAPAGYKIIDQKGAYILYKNKNSLSLGFATNRTISQRDFNQLTFPENTVTVFERIIVENVENGKEEISEAGFKFQSIDLKENLPKVENQKNVVIKKIGDRFQIEAKDGASIEIPLTTNMRDNILFLRFNVSDRENLITSDTAITINGLRNKLSSSIAMYPNGNNSFVYILSSNKKSSRLTISFSPGKYEIFDLEAITLPTSTVGVAIKKMDPFIVDVKHTGDNKITGDIQVSEDGYFATTIPFDKGFEVTVDGKKQVYEKVNTAFVGFPIEKGLHHIVIQYTAPYKKAGMGLSLIGFILFIFSGVSDRRYRLKNRTIQRCQNEGAGSSCLEKK